MMRRLSAGALVALFSLGEQQHPLPMRVDLAPRRIDREDDPERRERAIAAAEAKRERRRARNRTVRP